jgi:ATP-dependent DNA helicase RecQ
MRGMSDHLKILQERFGYSEFRPGQREVIEALCKRGAALAVFPTGGGKSLCYELPALIWDGITLVVSPLIALMKNQIDYLHRLGIPAARMDSSLTEEEKHDVSEQLRSGKLKLLYVAPERFNNERFLELIRCNRIALFAIDEAHCISEWGHNFRPDYLKLAQIVKELDAERVLALTATATPSVVEDICTGFGIARDCAIVTSFYRPNLALWTTPLLTQNRDAFLLDRLKSRKPGAAIVYVTLQKTAERVAMMLENAGYPARPYHAGMEAEERANVQEWWMTSDQNIVVATIAFGMGIDKADVRYVYHYNLPKGLESYSQEIGRAGRDGQSSIVELLACTDDIPTLENFVYGDTPSESSLRRLVEHLMSQPAKFNISLYELSILYDIRQMVLRTILTHMELLGFLHQHTPFYASYKLKPLIPVDEIVNGFEGERAQLVTKIFAEAKRGPTWYTLDPGKVAKKLGQERLRLIRALEDMEERHCVELQATDVRHSYWFVRRPHNVQELVGVLTERFARREQQEVARVSQVIDLVMENNCQTNALIRYFGELRDTPCGHCTWCKNGKPQQLPNPSPLLPLPARLDVAELRASREENYEALGDSRQTARFLCGLGSPVLTKYKLTRHPLFGIFEMRRFQDVLAWCGKL